VPHDDLFPIELLTLHAQESLLSEFSPSYSRGR
jgi:hypothetical protein